MTIIALRTADFDRRRRVEAFKAAAAHICKLDIVPDGDSEYRSETVIAVAEGLVIADTSHSACVTTRDSRLAAETGDNVLIHIPIAGRGFAMRQAGGEDLVCRPGDVYVDPTEVTGTAIFHGGRNNVLYVSMPRSVLAGHGDAQLRRRLALNPEWRVFRNFMHGLHREMPGLDADRTPSFATHAADLALLALGATGEIGEMAARRGLRHARLVAIKADIDRHLTSNRLSLGWLAGRHGISERYIRALFADEGTGFGDYVADARLAFAHRLLSEPVTDRRTIGAIAFAAGFGDISWFNARFRRAYGMTPKEARAEARAITPNGQ